EVDRVERGRSSLRGRPCDCRALSCRGNRRPPDNGHRSFGDSHTTPRHLRISKVERAASTKIRSSTSHFHVNAHFVATMPTICASACCCRQPREKIAYFIGEIPGVSCGIQCDAVSTRT